MARRAKAFNPIFDHLWVPAPSIPTTSMDTLTPELLTWVQTTAPRYGLSPGELIRRCTAEHGDNGVAIVKSETERAMAALGVPATPEPAVRIGDKPTNNETIILKKTYRGHVR
ncbi:hypothetical protein BD779DRAFT_1475033 [Infundibulicybe gibba]|nr:hypothetical protein BD779DRAFT_1475033 [Infundibulicybe gibba]